VDEAFARAFASWRSVSRHPAPTAWEVRTALNANISRWRRRRREVSVPDPGLAADPAMAERADTAVDPKIMAVLMRLPARQRQVVALRLFLDLDTARTAEVLGVDLEGSAALADVTLRCPHAVHPRLIGRVIGKGDGPLASARGRQDHPGRAKAQVSGHDLGVYDGCAARDSNPEPAD
jgi:hypothetical protein